MLVICVSSGQRIIAVRSISQRCILKKGPIESLHPRCAKHLGGRYDLEIVDFVSEPAFAASKQLFAAPTLINESPPPIGRFIGDMAQTERIPRGLYLSKPEESALQAGI